MNSVEHTAAPTAARNVDPEEAARYGALAATWWDRSGPFWPLHRLNALRSGYLCEALCREFGRDTTAAAPLAGLRILDVGCGGGILAESMARLGARVHGIDVVPRNIAIAREHALGSGLAVRYDAVSAADLAAEGARYDVVLNMEVVEHVPDVPALLTECAALVAPGGAMAVATINRTLKAWLFAIVGAEYVLGWLPRGTHRWDRFVTPGEVTAVLGREGLSPVERHGVRVNPFTRAFSLSGDLAVNYMILLRRGGTPVTAC